MHINIKDITALSKHVPAAKNAPFCVCRYAYVPHAVPKAVHRQTHEDM